MSSIANSRTSLLNAIGNTPLVELVNLNTNPYVKVMAKIEGSNPGGSVKDRAALSMIQQGEQTGELTHDKTIVEATSGRWALPWL